MGAQGAGHCRHPATYEFRVEVTVRNAGDNLPMQDHGLTAEQNAWVYEQLESGVSREELSARLRKMGDLIALEQEGVITIEPLPNGSALVVSVDPSDW